VRVLHVIADLNTGGAEGMLKRLIGAHQDTAEFEHEVISLKSAGTIGPQLQEMGIAVTALDMRGHASIPLTLMRLARLFRRRRPDLVQTWMYHADLLGGVAARMAGIRLVAWGVRVSEFNRDMGLGLSTRLLRPICALLSKVVPDAIIYVAHSARKSHERIGYAKDRGHVIVNGYTLPAVGSSPRLRQELGLGDDELVVGTAGRFTPQKDPKGFIEICSALASRHSNLHVVMIGRGFDGANQDLSKWIKASGYSDRIHLLGERPDLQFLLSGMDIFCLNSVGEGLPNVVAEAMSAGIPCVATDVGDTAYLLGDGGVVVRPRDADAFREALAGLLNAPEQVRKAMGEKGRARIATHFGLQSVVHRYEELYRELALAHPASGR
jgi:glycosyltransferase involved in cell wall biosynthesis